MKDSLQEFEDFERESSGLKKITILLVSILIIGFWGVWLANNFSPGFSNADNSDFYILSGGTLIISAIVYLFAKRNRAGWFLLCLILSFLLGLFTNSIITESFHFRENPEAWREVLLILMFLNTLSALILMFLNKTKKRLLISNTYYFICIVLCGLLSVVSYFLVL
jgi:hypothetical protein